MSEQRELSYLELALDNIIGFDNGYDSAGERFGRWFNKDEGEALKTIGKGAYDGAKEFVTSPIETTKEAVSDVYNSGKDLVTKDLEARVEEMFGVPYFLATPEQINKAKEGVFGDIANVSGVVPSPASVAKSAAKNVGQNIFLSKDTLNLSQSQKDAFEEAERLQAQGHDYREIKDGTAHLSDDGIGVDGSLGEGFLLEIPDNDVRTWHDNPSAPPPNTYQGQSLTLQAMLQDISRRQAFNEITHDEAMAEIKALKESMNVKVESEPKIKAAGTIDEVTRDLPAAKHVSKEWQLNLNAKTTGSAMGGVSPSKKELYVYPKNNPTISEETNTLLHEIQHIIDRSSPSARGEGFSPVRVTDRLKDKFDKAYSTLAKDINTSPLFKQSGFNFTDKSDRDDLLGLVNKDGTINRENASQWFEGQEPHEGWEALGRIAKMAENFRVLSVATRHNIYEKELGEVKARLVEWSKDFTPEMRQRSMLSDRYVDMQPEYRGATWVAEDFTLGGMHNPVKESTTESVIDTILKDYE